MNESISQVVLNLLHDRFYQNSLVKNIVIFY